MQLSKEQQKLANKIIKFAERVGFVHPVNVITSVYSVATGIEIDWVNAKAAVPKFKEIQNKFETDNVKLVLVDSGHQEDSTAVTINVTWY